MILPFDCPNCGARLEAIYDNGKKIYPPDEIIAEARREAFEEAHKKTVRGLTLIACGISLGCFIVIIFAAWCS